MPSTRGLFYGKGVLDSESLRLSLEGAIDRFTDEMVRLLLEVKRDQRARRVMGERRGRRSKRAWGVPPTNTNVSIFLDRFIWLAQLHIEPRLDPGFRLMLLTTGLLIDRPARSVLRLGPRRRRRVL